MRPAGPADLLVVGNDGIRRLVMDDKAQVGLVVAHAQGVGGDQDLEPVVQQLVFEVLPVGIGILEVVVFDVAEIGLGGNALGAQPVGDESRVALGQGVDDAGPRQFRQVLGEPCQSVGLRRQAQGLQGQAVARLRSPRCTSRVPSCVLRSSTTRGLAVAVVARRGTLSGMACRTPASRR